MKKTLGELEIIKTEQENEQKRRQLSIELGYCPECGAEIIEQPVEIIISQKRCISWRLYFYTKTIKREKRWAYREVCPNDVKHHERKCDNLDWD